MQPQDKLAELREVRQEIEAARHKGIATPAVLQQRAAAAETAFLGLAAAVLNAPDPVPLLRATAVLRHTSAGAGIARASQLVTVVDPSHGPLYVAL